jgi:hypothetical protein
MCFLISFEVLLVSASLAGSITEAYPAIQAAIGAAALSGTPASAPTM